VPVPVEGLAGTVDFGGEVAPGKCAYGDAAITSPPLSPLGSPKRLLANQFIAADHKAYGRIGGRSAGGEAMWSEALRQLSI